jgi:hypothetical protein
LEERGFGLKGVTDKPDVFLGRSLGQDQEGTLWWGAKQYIARGLDTYEQLIGTKPKPCNVPLLERTQPEFDNTDELNETGRSVYQSLIGCLQWVVTLGRFDIACAVMTMSRFRVAPRKGHLDLLGNVFGYLQKYPDGAIRFHTDTPSHEDRFTPCSVSWERSVYREPFEEIPEDTPVPKAKPVWQTGFFTQI